MSNLFPLIPAFLDLAGRRAVLLSAEAALAELARRLIGAGAGVTAFDREPSPAMTDLGVRIVPRRWRASDLQGAAFVAAGPSEPRRGRARVSAKAARAIFYSVSDPDFSDVAFGASGGQGRLAIGVAAAGLPPAVQEAIARRIEAVVPDRYQGFLQAAQACRAKVADAAPDGQARSAFWRAAAEDAFAAAPADWEQWLMARLNMFRSG
jgi:uroporphyrin-III C-methyltransferase/precorrin-2 dehydrogenase/sirohydrochlorin ferrochelatase